MEETNRPRMTPPNDDPPLCPKCGAHAREGICDRCDRFLRPRVKRSDKNYWQARISYEIANKKAERQHLKQKRWNPVLQEHISNEELAHRIKADKNNGGTK